MPVYSGRGGVKIFIDPAGLRAFVRELPEVRQGVQGTADAIAGTARLHAPVGHDTRHGHRPGALRGSITTQRPNRGGRPGSTVRVVVGVFYGKFVEFGTRYARPHPFMRPAANAYRSSRTSGG